MDSNKDPIERLHALASTWYDRPVYKERLHEIADLIQAQYMRLPVDADGVPTCFGDRMHYEKYDQTFTVNAIVYSNGLVYVKDAVNGNTWKPDECRHVKPDTVEGLLQQFAEEAILRVDKERIAGYAERIRKAVEDE